MSDRPGIAADRPLKVLIAADTYPPHVNGAATFGHRLATALHARGHEVHVVMPRSDAGPDTVEHRPEATVHLLRSLPAPTHEYYRVVLPRHAKTSFRRIYREVQPDVVHAQCHYMIGEAAINEAERRRIRIVSTNHFMPENLEPFLPFPQWFLDIVSRVSWKDMGRLMGKGAVVTTPTALAAQAMAEHAGLDNVLPVSNGIDASAYELQPGEKVDHPGHPVVLFVGRLAVEKNVEVLIRAIAHLARARPDLDVHAEIVGDGERHRRHQHRRGGVGDEQAQPRRDHEQAGQDKPRRGFAHSGEQCIRRQIDGTLDAAGASMIKLWATDMQCRVVDKCLQLFGGYGYMMEYPIAQMYTASRVQRIYGGTNEIMKLLVARSL